ncbi:hypothetical protein SAMN05216588_113144 [Pseudomonas flavescens]|uniref:Uncharacterized protein n=1 Tax=Phytopseudomonas flavescens TaxID=29435 RepID=A0A1G8J0V5_9GAMM|nr:hypothetical protein SAMN05216588_113144 [Pseudomonas flavescens]
MGTYLVDLLAEVLLETNVTRRQHFHWLPTKIAIEATCAAFFGGFEPYRLVSLEEKGLCFFHQCTPQAEPFEGRQYEGGKHAAIGSIDHGETHWGTIDFRNPGTRRFRYRQPN